MNGSNHKPKIALMSYAMDNRKAKGIALYTRKLIEGLLEDDRFEFYLVHYEKVSDPLYKKANEIIMSEVRLPYGSKFVSQILFFWKYRKNGFDIVHWFHPRLYPFYSFAPAKKIVVTVHGAGDITAPHSFVFSRSVFNFILKNFHRSINAVIVDSESAKLEVLKHYRFSPEQVRAIYLGGSEDYKPLEKNVAKKVVSEKYGINNSYILDISRLQPHKNVTSLIKSYELLRKDNPERKEELVIVGAPTSTKVEEYEIAKKSQFADSIRFVDYVDVADLNAFYSASEVFVFPSLDEGFGLPVLEAMASGVPVITSNISSLPEIAGEAAVTVDPLNINALASAMNRVLSDKEFAKTLVDSGLVRAAKFTWSETIERTKQLYNELLKNNG